ncbi:SchA/CurD-like domain-containing protein [Embleya scabrispora]|uniref:SchA/CurD-like domain-containing protein n=1 Tax=Embleya scabrispora TaxID=159449 RepID=UPI000381EA0D|nr:SchA/CurD-like domain-containing protein [Embleya scabrispora]MYS80876.1 TcmI family type II polyketide cyclase [Streptomyces sp. SID5474]
MDTLVHSAANPTTDTLTKLRVLLMLELHEGSEQRFLEAYERIRHQVAAVPGHVRDQLCQSIEDPTQWLITSEWEGSSQYLAWVDSPEHQMMVQPLHGCVRGTRSLRFAVVRETDRVGGSVITKGAAGAKTKAAMPGKSKNGATDRATAGANDRTRVGASDKARSGASDKARAAAPAVPGVVRCALTFTVKPGSEAEVARILAGYKSPKARVNDTTSLRRTTVFMLGNRVVRAIEVQGDLRAALRHVAEQPQVRAAEELLHPYLEETRDLNDSEAGRLFFMRSSLAEAYHLDAPAGKSAKASTTRRALLYPVRHGRGESAATVLQRHDEQVIASASGPIASSSVFVRGDILIRVLDLRGDPDDPALLLGIDRKESAARLSRLLDIGGDDALDTDEGLRHLLASAETTLVTDRRADRDV